ncbi:centaurin-gamma-1A-like [Portunus trituberculatus]|uniref:centaurin-gamma-1A-like n=1 Tax=Portunus trituberculatus TaxID=210409 RepID=UPI001E1D14D8|nr:centaurin-gamma-1A-like [Portunus trituberculatus]
MNSRHAQPYLSSSLAIRQEIQRFESVHPSIYAIYDIIELIPDPVLAQQIREHVVCIEDSFVNSQEWTLSRGVPDLRLGIVGSLSSGKSALVHRYLTGSYMQEESPEGGRFKKEIVLDGQSYLLLIRDEGGPPELQFTAWVDAVIFVFSLENESSFNAIYNYYAKMAHYRNTAEVPLILVGTQDGISENNPRVIDDGRARKLASDLKRCSYYETCATYGLNVERVFHDACSKIVAQRLSQQGLTPNNSRPGTPTHLLRYAPTNNGYTPAPYSNIPTPLTPQLTSGQQITPPISGSSPSHVYTNTITKLQALAKSSSQKLPFRSRTPEPQLQVPEEVLHILSYLVSAMQNANVHFTDQCNSAASINYMEDVHGKEISLQYTTVKVPGMKPRGSKVVGGSSGSDPLASDLNTLSINPTGTPGPPLAGRASLTGPTQSNKDKVTLMSYETLQDPARVNGIDSSSISSKIETPNVKKRHRRMKSTGNKNAECEDSDGYEFSLVSLDNKQWHFEAASQEERDEWVTVIEQQILCSLQGNESNKSRTRQAHPIDPQAIITIKNQVPGNLNCVDCDAPNPEWASINLGVLMCIECSGIHRNLGSHISKVRSLDLDEWPSGPVSVMMALGNEVGNHVWEANLRGQTKPNPWSSREDKECWIRVKYEGKEFLAHPQSNIPLNEQIVDCMCRGDTKRLSALLPHAGDTINNPLAPPRDMRTALHLAAGFPSLPCVQLLLWSNANVKALDADGRSILFYARRAGDKEVIDLLLQNGCPDTSLVVPPHTPALSHSTTTTTQPSTLPRRFILVFHHS